jgi:hypothetical protein
VCGEELDSELYNNLAFFFVHFTEHTTLQLHTQTSQ